MPVNSVVGTYCGVVLHAASTEPDEEVPAAFADGIAVVSALAARPEIILEIAPPPRRLAPFAFALNATIEVNGDDVGTGRLVLLHDPARPASWSADTRVVAYIEADVEPDIAEDTVVNAVGWSWLTDALDAMQSRYMALGATVTTEKSTSFGALAERGEQSSLAIRASWSTDVPGTLGEHARAWLDLMAVVAGLDPGAT